MVRFHRITLSRKKQYLKLFFEFLASLNLTCQINKKYGWESTAIILKL